MNFLNKPYHTWKNNFFIFYTERFHRPRLFAIIPKKNSDNEEYCELAGRSI